MSMFYITWASLKLGEFSWYLAMKNSHKLEMLGYRLLIEFREAYKSYTFNS